MAQLLPLGNLVTPIAFDLNGVIIPLQLTADGFLRVSNNDGLGAGSMLDPKGNLAQLVGFDPNGNIIPLQVTASGLLRVNVENSQPLPTMNYATLYMQNAQNINNVTITKVLLSTILTGTAPMCDTANSRIVIQEEDDYDIIGQVAYAPFAATRIISIVYVNGVQIIQSETNTGAGSYGMPHVHVSPHLAVGDVVELYTYHNRGSTGALSVHAGNIESFLSVSQKL